MGDQPPHGRISSDVDLRILRRTPLRATSAPLGQPSVDAFVDSVKTELIPDRVWRTRSQLELAIIEWVAWFNTERLHESLGDIPPAEFEATSVHQPATPLLASSQ